MTKVDARDLSGLLRYSPESGKLFWLERSPNMFTDGRHTAAHTCARWNSAFSGREAFTAATLNGYLHGRIWGRGYLAHRVIWALIAGQWPSDEIDHINGNRKDNRTINLRAASHIENSKNTKIRSDNSTGYIGVCLPKRTGVWVAYITINRKRVHLGSFNNFDAAVAARQSAAQKHGFHENHGRQLQ